MSDTHLTQTRFDSFDLPSPVLAALNELGFSYCTPIQESTLPHSLGGSDVCGQAQTGTGKTAAFLVSTFTRLLRLAEEQDVRQPSTLIIAPTRELAIQIAEEAQIFSKYCGLKQVAVYGGTGYDSQKKQLEQGVDIIIGTPGRIIDYFKQKVFSLKHIQVTVVDEADRMFDLGFIKDIRYLLRRMPEPEQRLSMLFSATLSYRVNELAYEHMNNPIQVEIEPKQVTAERITESVYYPASDEKIPLLISLLRSDIEGQTLIFTNTKHVAEKVAAFVNGNGFKVSILTGDIPQKKRMRLLQDFSEGISQVLVATDVAARGLHIPDVSHVINYDLPQDAEDYVHRIGRTGRAGASGTAISFACEDSAIHLPEIEEYIGHKIENASINPDELVKPDAPINVIEKKRTHGKDRKKDSRGSRGGASKKHHQRRRSPSR